MYSASTTAPTVGATSWFSRVEGWLDDRGRGAWMAAMILGFVFFWPIGLALLVYMISTKRMSKGRSCNRTAEHRMGSHWGQSARASGNAAFDAYKAEMLQRLETEQSAFEAFMQRLRDAKDKSEFDAFMEDRAKVAESRDIAPVNEGRAGAY